SRLPAWARAVSDRAWARSPWGFAGAAARAARCAMTCARAAPVAVQIDPERLSRPAGVAAEPVAARQVASCRVNAGARSGAFAAAKALDAASAACARDRASERAASQTRVVRALSRAIASLG